MRIALVIPEEMAKTFSRRPYKMSALCRRCTPIEGWFRKNNPGYFH
jgi:hypothetical protein